MSGSDLISAYVASLRRVLPAVITDEVEDGLTDAYAHYRASGYPDREAAEAAVAEFGDGKLLAAEFTRQSAGRRTARALLATGPIAGTCWGAALVTTRAWTWPVPPAGRLAFGLALVLAVAILITAATSLSSYQRARLAIPAGIWLITLDTTAIATALAAAPAPRWILGLAITASITRIAFTTWRIPRIAAH